MFSKSSGSQKDIGSLIGAGSTITGDLVFAGGLRIDGVVKGAVRCVDGEKAGLLVISEQGSVEGEVRAAHVVVAGQIVGPVFATELIELQPRARVAGDVHYRALEMHNGAVVDGMLIHHPTAVEVRGKTTNLKLAATSSSGESKAAELKSEPALGNAV